MTLKLNISKIYSLYASDVFHRTVVINYSVTFLLGVGATLHITFLLL
jgi:hypothetical protein